MKGKNHTKKSEVYQNISVNPINKNEFTVIMYKSTLLYEMTKSLSQY